MAHSHERRAGSFGQQDAVGVAAGDGQPLRSRRADQHRRWMRGACSSATRVTAERGSRAWSRLAGEQRPDRRSRSRRAPPTADPAVRRSAPSIPPRRGRASLRNVPGACDRGSRSPSPRSPGCAPAAGSSPTPTASDFVTASAVAAIVRPPDRKQSSINPERVESELLDPRRKRGQAGGIRRSGIDNAGAEGKPAHRDPRFTNAPAA